MAYHSGWRCDNCGATFTARTRSEAEGGTVNEVNKKLAEYHDHIQRCEQENRNNNSLEKT